MESYHGKLHFSCDETEIHTFHALFRKAFYCGFISFGNTSEFGIHREIVFTGYRRKAVALAYAHGKRMRAFVKTGLTRGNCVEHVRFETQRNASLVETGVVHVYRIHCLFAGFAKAQHNGVMLTVSDRREIAVPVLAVGFHASARKTHTCKHGFVNYVHLKILFKLFRIRSRLFRG